MQQITLMGILNTSPESFFDGASVKVTQNYALNKAQDLVAKGAGIIDIGGQSTKPGYVEITTEEEIHRTVPFIKLLKSKIKAQISIDSYKLSVIKSALEVGANIINDVSGLEDENIAKISADFGVKLVLMHKGTVESLENMVEFFKNKIKQAQNCGIKKENLILDIGLGFGKSVKENWFLLENLNYFDVFNLPLLVGASRKRFTGNNLVDSLKAAKLATKINCPLILRVHEVKETKEALNL